MKNLNSVKSVKITPVSMISRDGLQRIDIDYICKKTLHLILEICDDNKIVFCRDIAFMAGEETFIADVQPGVYRVAGYQDKGLKSHTEYFYRVCAVNDKGIAGEISEVFSGIAKEGMV